MKFGGANVFIFILYRDLGEEVKDPGFNAANHLTWPRFKHLLKSVTWGRLKGREGWPLWSPTNLEVWMYA